ncbi:hypothetical protein BACI348_20019 [Bacillus altitudinis]|uniref:Uncharacterized protein n=1 Tax=Bacillus altitudinis TaxID=293387 RepID=A0A653M0E4_BACAB|nr:hypothetical protein BACI9J_110040 [Bacillus altitudinis]VXA97485.1 hypothetical protein BACI348_20019 [Bacillus altitudinis]
MSYNKTESWRWHYREKFYYGFTYFAAVVVFVCVFCLPV